MAVGLLALTACGRPAAQPGGPSSPPSNPARSTPSSESAPLPTGEGATLRVGLGQKASTTILVAGRLSTAGLQVTAKRLLVQSSANVRYGVANPFGEAIGETILQPFLVGRSHHLLLTATDGRVTHVYVLVPGPESLKVALTKRVDWGAEVKGERVKLSARTYKDDGSVVITSELYQYNPKSRQYEKAPA